jgi:hypothetical protein
MIAIKLNFTTDCWCKLASVGCSGLQSAKIAIVLKWNANGCYFLEI